MRISKMIYEAPEMGVLHVIDNQKTVSTSKLDVLFNPVLVKLQWQEEALANNVVTIRKLAHRVNKAEEFSRKNRRMIADFELAERVASYERGDD